MDTQKRLHDKISALADGELPLADAELAFAALDTPSGWSAWNAYHQIGHTLRSSQFGAELSAGFNARLARRLRVEDAAQAPAPAAARPEADAAADDVTVTDSGLP